ncbi:porphobilinogen deaminase [Dichotomocladium elegans]|nr:porphobilinogen deaminase [Dichotomocladium elegans]
MATPNSSSKSNVFVIGTRRSQLALAQAYIVRDELAKKFPSYEFKIEAMATTGDRILNVALSKIGEKSVFTKELEVALEEGRLDLIVHSMKDLPTTLEPGMAIGAVLEREVASDALVLPERSKEKAYTIETLPAGSVIGTSSLRRTAQIKHKRPDLEIVSVRGNIHTRLNKLDDPENKMDAIVLAAAGLMRVGLGDRITQLLDDFMLHAVSQGALAIECRKDDTRVLEILQVLNDEKTNVVCNAERALMRELEGGCSVPIGVRTHWEGSALTLKGMVAGLDGKDYFLHEDTAQIDQGASLEQRQAAAIELGQRVAQKLLDSGADKVLRELNSHK